MKITVYKFFFILLLTLSLFATNINAVKMNFFGNSISIHFNAFQTPPIYLLIVLLVIVSSLFVLNKRLSNKHAIVTLLILYFICLIGSLLVSICLGHKITAGVLFTVIYPLFALPFLIKGARNDQVVAYLIQKIKLFVYLAIIFGAISLIMHRSCSFLDLLILSLLYITYELFEKQRIKSVLLVVLFALMSGFDLTWLFTFVFAILGYVIYNLKKFNFKKSFILLAVIFIFIALSASVIFVQYSSFVKLPNKKRFDASQLIFATGRTALWQKYILHYDGNVIQTIFGHGNGFVYDIQYSNGMNYQVSQLHNTFFDEFYKRGIIGLFLLMIIIFVSLKSRAPVYLKFFLVLLLINGQSGRLIYDGVPGIIFWITVGMLNSYPADKNNPVLIAQ